MNKNRDNYTKINISALQLLGYILIVTGLILVCGFGALSIRSAKNDAAADSSLCEYDDDELTIDEEPVSCGKSILSGGRSMMIVLTGGLMLIFSLPCFYLPCGYTTISIRFRRSRSDEAEDRADSEFDYPDDDYDYVTDKAMRRRLIRYRNEQRRLERKRNKQF